MNMKKYDVVEKTIVTKVNDKLIKHLLRITYINGKAIHYSYI